MKDSRLPGSRRRRRRNAPKILRVDRSASEFRELIEAAAERGFRVGWLELEQPAEVDGPLEQAAELGVLRAVSLSEHRAVSVKPLKGKPVLGDVMREHFTGCVLVLVRSDRPLDSLEDWCLEPEADGWRLRLGGPESLSDQSPRERLLTAALLDRLRSPAW